MGGYYDTPPWVTCDVCQIFLDVVYNWCYYAEGRW